MTPKMVTVKVPTGIKEVTFDFGPALDWMLDTASEAYGDPDKPFTSFYAAFKAIAETDDEEKANDNIRDLIHLQQDAVELVMETVPAEFQDSIPLRQKMLSALFLPR